MERAFQTAVPFYLMIREMAFAYTKGIILDRWIQQHMPEIRSYHVCLGRQ
jgi:hypothetical protein